MKGKYVFEITAHSIGPAYSEESFTVLTLQVKVRACCFGSFFFLKFFGGFFGGGGGGHPFPSKFEAINNIEEN